MSSFLTTLASGLSMIQNSPAVEQYAGPVLLAVLTGSTEIKLPGGAITITQTGGNAARFTLGSAGLALEEFLLTGDVDITIGTTEIKWVPNANKQPVLSAPAQSVPAPAGQ